jgi:dipeptidyl aminopeptidase/acylaminoacyl peptidase
MLRSWSPVWIPWLFLVVVSPFSASAAPPPPAEAFAALPQFSELHISPDGKTLAWQEQSGEIRRIVMFDIASRQERRSVRIEPPMTPHSMTWVDANTLLLQVKVDVTIRRTARGHEYEYYRTLALDLSGGEPRGMLMTGKERTITSELLISDKVAKPQTIIMATLDHQYTSSQEPISLFEVNTRTGDGTRIELGTPYTDQWLVDQDGAPVARSEWHASGKIYRILAKNPSGWHDILHRENHDKLRLYGLTPDNSGVVVLSAAEQGRVSVVALPLDGSSARVLLEDRDHDVAEIIRDGFSGKPVAAVLDGIDDDVRWFDPAAEKRHEVVARAFPGKRVRLSSESEDRLRLIANVDGPSNPPTYYLIDLQTHRADIVGEAYPALRSASLGEAKPVTYKARDGVEIPAYLTLPPDSRGKSQPMVVYVHPGPNLRDHREFDWMAQYFASRGYVVFQPQFRGSSGFGESFRIAGHHQWGGLMQDDVTDGVKALIEQGIADPRRICIVGEDYGGYAALAGVAFTPELYACAISLNGISNLPGQLAYMSEHGFDQEEAIYWNDDIGSRFDPKVVASSPINAVTKIKSPVLLIYSDQDTLVPPYQSEGFAQALKKSGGSVALVKLSGEDHWLSHTESRVTMLKEVEAFLAKPLHN